MIAAIIVAKCKCRQTYFGGTLTWCRKLAKYLLHFSSLRHYWPPPASMLPQSVEAVCDASRCVFGDEASHHSSHQSRWKPFTTLIGAFYWLDTHVVTFICPQTRRRRFALRLPEWHAAGHAPAADSSAEHSNSRLQVGLERRGVMEEQQITKQSCRPYHADAACQQRPGAAQPSQLAAAPLRHRLEMTQMAPAAPRRMCLG